MRGYVKIRLNLSRQVQINAPIAGMNVPATLHLRPAARSRRHAPISRLDIQHVEAPLQVHVPISRRHIHMPVQVPPFDRPIPGAQPYIPFGPCTLMLPSPVCTSKFPLMDSASTDPSPVLTVKSASFGMCTSTRRVVRPPP